MGPDLKERLREGKLCLGLNTPHSRTPEIAPILRTCGFHWMLIDAEHHPMPMGRAYEIALAAIRAGIFPFVRPRTNSAHEIGAHLTNGALGVLVPHVNTEEQAVAAARASRYSPRGDLSVPGVITQFGYDVPLTEAAERFNREALCITIIESREAVSNVEKIAAVDGIDGLLVGMSDLTFEMGIPGGYGHPDTQAAVERVCRAAKAQGKFVGMGGVKAPEDWKRYMKMGVRMVMTENDLSMLIARMKDRAAYFSDLLD